MYNGTSWKDIYNKAEIHTNATNLAIAMAIALG